MSDTQIKMKSLIDRDSSASVGGMERVVVAELRCTRGGNGRLPFEYSERSVSVGMFE